MAAAVKFTGRRYRRPVIAGPLSASSSTTAGIACMNAGCSEWKLCVVCRPATTNDELPIPTVPIQPTSTVAVKPAIVVSTPQQIVQSVQSAIDSKPPVIDDEEPGAPSITIPIPIPPSSPAFSMETAADESKSAKRRHRRRRRSVVDKPVDKTVDPKTELSIVDPKTAGNKSSKKTEQTAAVDRLFDSVRLLAKPKPATTDDDDRKTAAVHTDDRKTAAVDRSLPPPPPQPVVRIKRQSLNRKPVPSTNQRPLLSFASARTGDKNVLFSEPVGTKNSLVVARCIPAKAPLHLLIVVRDTGLSDISKLTADHTDLIRKIESRALMLLKLHADGVGFIGFRPAADVRFVPLHLHILAGVSVLPFDVVTPQQLLSGL